MSAPRAGTRKLWSMFRDSTAWHCCVAELLDSATFQPLRRNCSGEYSLYSGSHVETNAETPGRADLEIAFYFGTQTTFRAEDLPGQNTAVWLRNLYKKDTQAYHRSKRMTLDLEPGLQASFLDLMSLSAFANGCSVCPTKLRAYTFHDLVILFGFRLVQIRPLQQPGFATRFETLLHLGLMAFLTTFLAGLSRKRPNFKSITDPLQWVIQAARGERDDFQKIVLWALLLGGDVLFTEADEDWFLPRVAEVTTVLKLEEWDDVEEIVTKFPWIRSIHGKTAMYLWQKSQGLISRTSD